MKLSTRRKIGKLIPYPLIENGRRVIHAGPNTCRVCGSHFRRMQDTGYGAPVLEQYQVVGGLRRPADQCPICHASCRDRLVWFWLTQGGQGFRLPNGSRIAHFAPEKGLSKALSSLPAMRYQAYDLDPARYRHLSDVREANLMSLDIADGEVDLVVCNHVVEHVPDVDTVLQEIRRVLSEDGVAILQVPIALKLEDHIELQLDSTPAHRLEVVGQDDHLRLFTPESYLQALQSAGLAVELFDAFEHDAEAATDWQLDPFEKLYLCRKA